jgi:hypothetical protein
MEKKIFLNVIGFLFLYQSLIAQVPSIEWQNFIGGTGIENSPSSLIKTYDGGYIFATGSNDTNTSANHGGGDAWVVKISSSGTIQWQKYFGGTFFDDATSIQQTLDGGYVISGFTQSFDGDVANNHGSDMWVLKLTSDGLLQWQKCLGGTGFELNYSIDVIDDGSYIVTGFTMSNNGDVSGNHGERDVWIVKLSNVGNIQWQKCLGGLNDDEAYVTKQTSDGGFIVLGTTNSNDGDVSGFHGSRDIWLIKLSNTGTIQWQRSLGGSGSEYAFDGIEQLSDGSFIVVGYTQSNDGDVSDFHGDTDIWVIKLSFDGNILWQKSIGGTNEEKAFKIHETNDSGYILAGYTKSNDGDVSGFNGNTDSWIIKLANNGILEWQRCLGGTGVEIASNIQQTIDGGYIIASTSNSNDLQVTGNHGNDDIWVVKLTNSGIIQWEKCYGGTLNETGSVLQTSEGGYIISGSSYSNDGDVLGNNGMNDVWILKLSPENLNVIDINKSELKLYPNPVNDKFFIKFNDTFNLNGCILNIVNPLGQKVYSKSIDENQTQELSIDFKSINGIYFVQIIDSQGQVVSVKKILKQ